MAMNSEINFGCYACKYFERGYSKLSGVYFVNGKPRPRVKIIESKCKQNKKEYEKWLNENIGKSVSEYSKAPGCFVACDGLQYVLDDLKRHNNET